MLFRVTCAAFAASAVFVSAQLSPYPVAACGPNGARTVYTINDDSLSADDVQAITSVAGVVARNCPVLYRNSSNSYATWISLLQTNYGVTTLPLVTFADVLKQFSHALSGYVLANAGDISSAVAYTAVAALDAVIVTPNNVAVAAAAGLPMLYDVRNQTLIWALDTFNVSSTPFNRRIAALQDPTKIGFVGDYTVFSRGIFWWDTDMTSTLSKRVLGSLSGPAAIFGWGTSEDQTVAAATTNGAYVHASDWAKNMAVLCNYRTAKAGHLAPPPAPPAPRSSGAPVHTVTFVMTDGDNIQWLLSGMTADPKWWGSPDRGAVPLGWTLSPALVELASVVYDVFADSRSSNDTFVAAPSGVGYTYPDMMSPAVLDDFTALTATYMNRSGLSIVNIIGEDYESANAAAFTAQAGVDAVVWYDYASYSLLSGNVTFANNKPIIGGRFQLWTGVFESPTTLLQKLLQQQPDPSSAAGYSLIPVHVWSNNVSEVRWVAEQLASHGGFQVVTPDVFVQLVDQNIAH